MTVFDYICESWAPGKPLTVSLTGAGNATHVLAGLLGSNPDLTVYILDVLTDECKRLQAVSDGTFTVEHEDGKPSHVGKVSMITSDPALVIPQTDLYLVTVPAFAHEVYFKTAAPYIRDGACIGVMVAQGGVDYCAKFSFGNAMKRVTFFAFQTLPWACRTTEFGRSSLVKGVKTGLDMITLPKKQSEACRDMATALLGLPMRNPDTGVVSTAVYPQLNILANFMSPTLMNPNAIVHISIIYGAMHDWDGTPFSQPPLFYHGLNDFGAEQMSGVCDEILAIKRVVLERNPEFCLDMVMHMREFVIYSYGDEILDQSSLRSSFNTNRAYKGLVHPCKEVDGGFVPDFTHRYITEDIPAGLVVIKGIALLAGVDTPYIDRQLYWAQERMGKEYLVDGQLKGRDMAETRAPQRYGITTLDDVLN